MKWTASNVLQCVALFALASALEIGGCYGFWRAVRLEKNKWWAAFGATSLVAYGAVFLLMPTNAFARIMAAYGGVFIASSYAFGAVVEGTKLDAGDYVGSSVALAGVGVCLFWPRE
jgi:drug/metabolite transporter superfamily protein YnfA